MKNTAFFIAGASIALASCKTNVKVSASETDAKIYLNGNYVADGSYKFPLKNKSCQNIKIEKPGFLTEEKKYCLDVVGFTNANQTEYFTLKKDDLISESTETDRANIDFKIEVSRVHRKKEAWKIVNQIASDYFEDIVTSNKESGYLVTTWKVQEFPKRTIRTRLVVKNSEAKPLTYKVKIESEIAYNERVSVKDDEQFKTWDRVLKKYEGVIGEYQTELGDK